MVAWRRLAEGVAASVIVGDPVIVYGRIYTRDWKDENGNTRISYEMEAYSIGHDLARGRARFFRSKAVPGTSAVEDSEAEALVGGELSVPVAAEEAPIRYGDGLPERLPDEERAFVETGPGLPVPEDAGRGTGSPDAPVDDELAAEVDRLVAATPGGSRRGRRVRREPVTV